MRKIKFRGKAIEDYPERNIKRGDWVYGYFIGDSNKCGIAVTEGLDYMFGGVTVTNVDCETVGQYAGFKDKNGKEVYRGDVVDFKYGERFCEDEENPSYVKSYRNVVVFKDGEFFPHPKMVYIEEDCWYSYKYFDFEVVGNIYDDPELKESKKQ